jgi:3'-phosphoadenosine 5'-phosphosulfate sulfotransferase (PAPS reductase)/FAD synthetase
VSGQATLLPTAEQRSPNSLIAEAWRRWEPVRTICLYSGGNDSSVLAHRCMHSYDELLYVDTGLAVPGVEDHVRRFADWLGKPLVIRRSRDAYRTMVLGDDLWWERFEEERGWNPEITIGQMIKQGKGKRLPRERYGSPPHGFPGPGQHRSAFINLKERRFAERMREVKQGHPRTASVLFLSGVRKAESVRRAKVPALTRPQGKSFRYCSALIDWSDQDMLDYRERHELPESDVAALLHRSGECQCGAFADAKAERAMIQSLWPEWWATTIAPLEAEAKRRGIRYCEWGGYDLEGNQAGKQEGDAGLCQSCPSRQVALRLTAPAHTEEKGEGRGG